jgi:hypothetical protein
MQWQTLAAVEDQVPRLVEADLATAEQPQRLRGAHRGETCRHATDVDRVGRIALQPEQHGLVAAMALAGGAQRAEQLDPHVGHPLQQALGLQPQREQSRRPHRADRVRARGADADLEEVEGADRHAVTLALG